MKMNTPQSANVLSGHASPPWIARTILVLLGSALLMTAYEVTKQSLFPTITLWESHAITIVFGALLATATAYVVSRRGQQFQQRTLQDVAERARAEQALRESEARYRSLVENAVEGIMVIQDRVCRYANPQVEELTGYAAAELASKPFTELVHPEDRPLVLERHRRRLAGEVGLPVYTFRFVDKAGQVKWAEVRAAAITWQGQPATLNLLRDVTERQRAEVALQRSEHKYRSVIEQSADGIVLADGRGAIIEWNRGMERITGRARAEAVGQPLWDFALRLLPARAQSPATSERFRAGVLRLLHHEGVALPEEGFDLALQRPDGTGRSAQVISFMIGAGPDAMLGIICRDVTERQRAEEEVRQLNRALEERVTERTAQLEATVKQLEQAGEQVRQQVGSLSALYAGAQELAQSLDSVELAEDAARTCVETFGLRLAWVARAEPDGRVRVLAQFPPELKSPRPVMARWDDTPEGQGPAGRAIRTGTPVVMNDLLGGAGDTPWRATLQQYAFRSAATLPLISRHTAIGAFMVYSDQPGYFTPERVQFFQSYTLLAAAALENARLFEETGRRLSHVQALRKIDTAISSSFDLRMTLDVILDQTTTQLNVDAAVVTLYDPRARVLARAAGCGFRVADGQLRLPLSEAYAAQVALERRTLVWDRHQMAAMAAANPGYRAFITREGFAVHAAAPLVAKGQVVGVLEVFHRAPLDAGAEWLAFLETLAGQAAIAIDSATLFAQLQRSNAELGLAYDSTLEGWSRALDLRDRETEGHSRRVSDMSERLAQALGLSESERVHLRRGALLHDIGKLGVPDGILLKPGPLTEEEWGIMRQHPQYAYDMLFPIQYLRPALDIPYGHHEKWDGTGYPRGLKGEEIPLAARLFAVADVWDALRSDRPYRAAWPEGRVRDHIRSLSGTHFDPQVVEAFLGLIDSARLTRPEFGAQGTG